MDLAEAELESNPDRERDTSRDPEVMIEYSTPLVAPRPAHQETELPLFSSLSNFRACPGSAPSSCPTRASTRPCSSASPSLRPSSSTPPTAATPPGPGTARGCGSSRTVSTGRARASDLGLARAAASETWLLARAHQSLLGCEHAATRILGSPLPGPLIMCGRHVAWRDTCHQQQRGQRAIDININTMTKCSGAKLVLHSNSMKIIEKC